MASFKTFIIVVVALFAVVMAEETVREKKGIAAAYTGLGYAAHPIGYSGLGYSGLGYGGLGYGGLGYSNLGYNGLGYSNLGYHGLGNLGYSRYYPGGIHSYIH